MMNAYFWTFAIVAYLIIDQVKGSVSEKCDAVVSFSEADLLQFILTNYSKLVRPKRSASLPVEVNVGLRISGVHELIERQNTFIVDGYLTLGWNDDFLVWNSTFPYSCVTNLQVPSDLIWLPEVAMINSPTGMYSLILESGFRVAVNSRGEASYSPAGQIVSSCQVDVTYFPFDKQVCSIEVESWAYNTAQQTLSLRKPSPFGINFNAWTENSVWQIEGNFTELRNIAYANGGYFHRITFSAILNRRALFYYINIIVPSLIIAIVELATFVLPIDEVIKIHISFTCLLAYSVFQGMVIADLPRSGDSVPALSLYLDLQMAYIGIIALLGEAVVFLAIRKAEKKKHPPPDWMLSVFTALGKVLAVDREFGTNQPHQPTSKEKVEITDMASSPRSTTATVNEETTNVGFDLRHISSSPTESPSTEPSRCGETVVVRFVKPSPGEVNRQWLFVAEVVEQFNMVAYITAIVITPIAMFVFVRQPPPAFKDNIHT